MLGCCAVCFTVGKTIILVEVGAFGVSTPRNSRMGLKIKSRSNPSKRVSTPFDFFESKPGGGTTGGGTTGGGGTTTGKTFLAQDSNASALFTILDSGDVGIGTTSPAAKLDVHGTISQTVDGATNQ